MLSRLSIRQKLSLLLVIPLVSVGVVMAGLSVERLLDARDHGGTARTANAARNIGALIQTLQQERLLALGYLAVPSLQRSALVTQSQTAVDDAARLAADPLTADVLAAAKPSLDALVNVRRGVINRTVTPKVAFDAYRAVNTALLDGLRLGTDGTPDAASLRELVALDALMRSNEEASSVGAIVVASANDPSLDATLLTTVVAADAQNLQRFKQLVPDDQASLVDTVENGQAGQRIHHLVEQIIDGHPPAGATEVSDALTAALTYTGLRRLAQDRVARDVATGAETRANQAEVTAIAVAVGATLLFVLVVFLGVTVTRSIARPLRRLTRAAVVVAELSRAELTRVADSDAPDPAPPQLASVEVNSTDEIGELAAALNRVQATAALLLERQVSTRTNTSVMFANIARRTQNLVGRQLTLIDELERNERDPELLQRLYRLDHMATRLRRSADSLLVVSGTIDQQLSGTPTRLADVVRSALAEIEGYQAVQLGAIPEIGIAADLVPDLRLLLAELMENATNFSPPGVPVEVTAIVEQDCYLAVVDHGVGLSATRLEEENRRLVERERLDVAPTRVLGLFVVGRLARRHGLGVRLDPSEGRGITATVQIPARLLAVTTGPVMGRVPAVAPSPTPALGAVPTSAIEALLEAERTGPFPWLAEPGPMAIEAGPSAAPVAPVSATPSVDDLWPGGVEAPAEPEPRPDDVPADLPSSAPRDAAPTEAPPAPAGPPPTWPPTPAPSATTLPRRIVAAVDPAFSADPHVAHQKPAPAPRPAAEPVTDAFTGSSTVDVSGGSTQDPAETARSGLVRRIPGSHLTDAVVAGMAPPSTVRANRDPEAERDALNDYLSGFARGAAASGEPGEDAGEGSDEELEARPTLAERHS